MEPPGAHGKWHLFLLHRIKVIYSDPVACCRVVCFHRHSEVCLILLLFTAQVTDEDIGINSEVDFSLDASVQDLFALMNTGPLSVDLHLINQLDRETTASYSFRIFVIDRGTPHLLGQTTILITVLVSMYTSHARGM